jgi:hypothetical protein
MLHLALLLVLPACGRLPGAEIAPEVIFEKMLSDATKVRAERTVTDEHRPAPKLDPEMQKAGWVALGGKFRVARYTLHVQRTDAQETIVWQTERPALIIPSVELDDDKFAVRDVVRHGTNDFAIAFSSTRAIEVELIQRQPDGKFKVDSFVKTPCSE